MNTLLEQHAQVLGVDVEQLKAAIKRFLPFLELAAQMTNNKYDDMVVDLLNRLVS
jgi:hypothetical protein